MKILAFHAHAGDPLSFVIKALTRSCYCHGAVLIDADLWRGTVSSKFSVPSAGHIVIEAFWPKVRARLLKDEELSEIDVFDVPSHTADKEAKSMQWLIDQVASGVSYDIPDLFRFLPENRAVIGEANDSSYKQHTFCSMLVFNAYRFGGTRLLNCHDYECSPDKMTWSPFAVPAPKLIGTAS